MIGTLWSTPISFAIQEGWTLGTQVVHADVLDGYEPSQDLVTTRPATPLSENPTDAFGLECVEWSGINFDDCFAILAYYIFYAPSGLILTLSGGIFDSFLALSVSPLLLNQDFVANSWATIRNLVNLLFILILLWIALGTILQIGGVQLKQAVANVIIVALLVNFSFFFTRVVIDASNVIAMEFYNRAGSKSSVGGHIQGVPEKRISERIMGSINPQALLSPTAFEKWKTSTNSSNAALIFLFFVAAIINVMIAYVLFYAGFLLVGRVIAFIFLIIASPLAFISYALPKGGSFTSSWWNQLLSQAMVAPVFLFFLYIIVQLLSGLGEIIKFSGAQATAGTSFTDLFTTVALKAAIVVVALMIALSKTKSLSGSAGQWATKAGTAVFGAAIGTTALAGRRLIGGGARALADSDRFKRFAARTGVVGEVADRGLRATSSGTMDIRGIPGMDRAGFGKAGGKGGYDKHLSEKVKRKEDLAKRLSDTKMFEYEQGPSGETRIKRDTQGNVQYQQKEIVDKKTGEKKFVDKTAKDIYTEKLEKRGDRLWGLSNREAAKKIKKGKTPEQELLDKIKEAAKEEVKAGAGEPEKAETIVKETEKPKET
ncbi:MAG: hypothetical protein Q7S11_03530 [bacterium]|nr:hypothetical protein [bacterium]